MSRRARAILAFLVGAGALLGSATPGSAGPACSGSNAQVAPDGRIKEVGSGEGWLGVDHYGQTDAVASMSQGEQVTFKLKWRNNEASIERIRVLIGGFRDPGFGVRWFVDGVNVTPVVKEKEKLVFKLIGPGASTPTLEFVVKNKSALGKVGTELLQAHHGLYGGAAFPACDEVDGIIDLAGP